MTADQARTTHQRADRLFRWHLDHCRGACWAGGQCSVGRDLLIEADAAGTRLTIARDQERFAARGRVDR